MTVDARRLNPGAVIAVCALSALGCTAANAPQITTTGNRTPASLNVPLVDPPPVYNALFFQRDTPATNVLLNGVRTETRFYIGPDDPANRIEVGKRRVDDKIIRAESRLSLLVSASCLVCDEDKVQRATVVYDPLEGRSTVAVFHWTPNASKATNGVGHVVFAVSAGGIELDHIAIKVGIGGPEVRVAASPAAPLTLPVNPAKADITFRFDSRSNGTFALAIDPHEVEIAEALGLGRDLTFQTDPLTNLNAVRRQGYLRLRGITDQQNDILKQASKGSAGGTFALPASSVFQLTAEQQKLTTTELATVGRTFYRTLFQRDGSLRDAMARFERFRWSSGRPVRVRIEVDGDTYLPWQLLHETSQPGLDKFWGMKYELWINPLERTAQGRLPGIIELGKQGSLFATYKGTSDDDVTRLGQRQVEKVTAAMPGHPAVRVDSNKPFLRALKERTANLQVVLAYTHASSGTVVSRQPDGTVVWLDQVGGPRLMFSPEEYVTSSEISALGLDSSDLFFSQRPLVVLNACETGTLGAWPATNVGFPQAWFDLGARGVLVTEAPVWMWFAYHFGNDLVTGLAKGEKIGRLLREMRVNYAKNGSPLGLLYSYYGSPDVTIDSN